MNSKPTSQDSITTEATTEPTVEETVEPTAEETADQGADVFEDCGCEGPLENNNSANNSPDSGPESDPENNADNSGDANLSTHEKTLAVAGPQNRIPIKGPSFSSKLKNYSKTMARHAANGFSVRSQAQIDALLAICKACPAEMYDAKNKVCLDCGCPLNNKRKGFKNKIASEVSRCSLGHWDKSIDRFSDV